MNARSAVSGDCPLLAGLNAQLIADEGHRNPMTIPELEGRMRGWLTGEYDAVIFESCGEVLGYALFREDEEEIYLRQLFVVRGRRREGWGRRAVEILMSEIWPAGKRMVVDVLVSNERAVGFWRAVGFSDYFLRLERAGIPESGMKDA